MNSLAIIILAAGKGNRMKSAMVKVLHPLAGVPMLSYSLDLARDFHPQKLIVVTGFQGDAVRQEFRAPELTFVDQKERIGHGTCRADRGAGVAGISRNRSNSLRRCAAPDPGYGPAASPGPPGGKTAVTVLTTIWKPPRTTAGCFVGKTGSF